MNKNYDVVIVGAGFGGIRLAIDAVAYGLSVCMVSDRAHFEYYPAMYRIVTGAPKSTVVMPLSELIRADMIDRITDHVISIDVSSKSITTQSGQVIRGSNLVLAFGITNSYFGIPGMPEHSYGFKSYEKATQLYERVQELFRLHHRSDIDEQLAAFRFVIAGGGVSGVELAGELMPYLRMLAKKYEVPESRVSIDIVESNPTLVPMLVPRAQKIIMNRLQKQGVRILCNRRVVEAEAWTVKLSDMTIAAKTVIWAAGVAPHPLLLETKGLPLSPKKRIVVNEYLQVEGAPNVYALGDCAETEFSGLAQTAEKEGGYLAHHLYRIKAQRSSHPYAQKHVAYDIPVGLWFGVLIYNNIVIPGILPWLLRFAIDIRFYFSILPVGTVMRIIREMITKK